MRIIAMQEIGRAGCGGVAAGLFSHTIGAPPILHRGSEAMKARVLPQVLSGEKISALAITEPSGGSDVANLRTTARRDADHHTFGKPIVQHQVIRHKLVDMAQRIEASQAMLELLTWRLEQGENPVAEICMLKNQATTTLAFCASEGVQIFGGAGFIRGVKVERIYREVKVNAIGAGTEEIMKDLASRQMGL